jgi:hypothetical protein
MKLLTSSSMVLTDMLAITTVAIAWLLFTIQHYYASYTGRFVMFFVITNIYNKKTKGPTLMELFTATGKLQKFFYN